MAGKRLTDQQLETSREEHRASVIAPPDKVEQKITELYGQAQQPIAAPGGRGGAVPRAVAEYQMGKYAEPTTVEGKARKAFTSTAWATATPAIKESAVSQAATITDGKLPWSPAFVRYPQLALSATKALNNGELTQKQLQTVVDATNLIDTTNTIVWAFSDTTRQKVFNRLSAPQQASVLALADVVIKEAERLSKEANLQQKMDQAAAQGQSPIIGFFGALTTSAMDGFMWLNNQAQHVYRASSMSLTQSRGLLDTWRDTSDGQMDPESIKRLKNEFGDITVNVLRDVLRAQNGTGGYDFSQFLTDYSNNDVALRIADQILIESERSQPLKDLMGRVDATRRDDLGNLTANLVFQGALESERGNNPLYTILDKGTNAAAIWFGDPTLIGAKAWKGYQAMKYGVMKNMAAGSLERVVAEPKVQRFFQNLGADVVRLDKTKDLAEAGILRNQMKVKYGKYVDDNAIDSLLTYLKSGGNVRNAKDFVETWMIQMDGLDNILKGQTARRSSDVLMPTMSKLRAKRIDARLRAQNAVFFGEENSRLSHDILLGDPDVEMANALADMSKKYQVKDLIEHLSNPEGRSMLAAEYGINLHKFKFSLGDGKIAYKYRGYDVTRGAWERRIDRWAAQLEKMPRGRAISIADASDADKVYQWARTTFNKYTSLALREAWVHADVGQRRLMLDGMFNTIIEAKGITGVDKIQEIVTSSSKAAEQYAVTQSVIKGIENAEGLADWSARAVRSVLPKLDTARQTRINGLNARMAELIDERKQIAEALSMAKGEASELKKFMARSSEIDADIARNADEIEALIRDLSREKTSGYFASKQLLAERQALKEVEGEAVRYNPAEVNGRQHALHNYQVENVIIVPDFSKIQQYSQKVGMINKVIGFTYNRGVDLAVDLWSMGNLYGPRYVARNVPEDMLGYVASGGSFFDLMRGRRMSTAMREYRGKKLGFIAEAGRKVADIAADTPRMRWVADQNNMIGRMLMGHLSKDEVLAAQRAAAEGNSELLQQLAIKSYMRQKLSLTGMTLDSIADDFFEQYIQRDDAVKLLDEIGETRAEMNTGRLIDPTDGVNGQYRADLKKDLAIPRTMEYRNVRWDEPDVDAFLFWKMHLTAVLHGDGRPGQIVFNALRGESKRAGLTAAAKERALPKLIDFFSSDDGVKWLADKSIKDEPGETIASIASRYFDDSAVYFTQRSSNLINRDLVQKLTRTNSKTGAKYGALHEKDEAGQIVRDSEMSIDKLRLYDYKNRPEQILGRITKWVGVNTDLSKTDRAWQVMTEALARISREPIFFANAISEYRSLQPLIKLKMAAGIEESVAKKMVMDLAVRRAEDITLSYVDNPAVRTALAFNVRNLARYYRATEDFYRRVGRMVQYYPETIQKLNLSYNMLDHSGFIKRDENGNQYFMYPGTGAVNEAVTKAFGALDLLFNGKGLSVTNPFALSGQTLMLTPSADPNSLLPTLASPVAALPVKMLTAISPFDQFESILLGSRGTKPTTGFGGAVSEAIMAMMPSHVLRGLAAMSKDDRDSQYASAVKSAMVTLAYNGEFDGIPETSEGKRGYKERMIGEIQKVALATLVVRFALGFVLPASPQITPDEQISAEARELGIKSFRPEFTKLINKMGGNVDLAFATWFKLNPSRMPYTVSSTEAVQEGYPSVTDKAGKWMQDNTNFVTEHPAAAAFLAPREGVQSFSAYALAKNLNLIKGKTIEDTFLQVLTAKDYYRYRNSKDIFDKKMADATSISERNLARDEWDTIRQRAFAQNPWLENRVKALDSVSSKTDKTDALDDVRLALRKIKSGDGPAPSDGSKTLTRMINAFDRFTADMAQVQGQTAYAVDARSEKRANIRATLVNLAGADQNAVSFYESILDGLIG